MFNKRNNDTFNARRKYDKLVFKLFKLKFKIKYTYILFRFFIRTFS